MAALLLRELGVRADLLGGRLGELTVWVDGRRVARKGWFSALPDERVLAAVRQGLGNA